jgi:hypothetical protein
MLQVLQGAAKDIAGHALESNVTDGKIQVHAQLDTSSQHQPAKAQEFTSSQPGAAPPVQEAAEAAGHLAGRRPAQDLHAVDGSRKPTGSVATATDGTEDGEIKVIYLDSLPCPCLAF